ncbi:Structural maintenance of chromosomes protein 6 [Gonapodya sp. JEL0774]|nr:Structural maintenance of chromosomes protein 6 [Gonapodya sp. JEL0774]
MEQVFAPTYNTMIDDGGEESVNQAVRPGRLRLKRKALPEPGSDKENEFPSHRGKELESRAQPLKKRRSASTDRTARSVDPDASDSGEGPSDESFHTAGGDDNEDRERHMRIESTQNWDTSHDDGEDKSDGDYDQEAPSRRKVRRAREEDDFEDGDGDEFEGEEGEETRQHKRQRAADKGKGKAVSTKPKGKRKQRDDEDEVKNEDSSPTREMPGKNVDLSKAGTPGTIEWLQLVNILCHKNLRIDFATRLEFVFGRNGSGKSSLLAALMLALGARADQTNRGRSLKELLSYGATGGKLRRTSGAVCFGYLKFDPSLFMKILVLVFNFERNHGEIRLSLWNQGPDGFRRREFGDKIRIERRIGPTGATTYRIKNADGVVVSTKRETLAQIMDHYGIDVANPLTVLQQDVAKNFLTKSTDADKYRFFHHGTGLQGLQNAYEQLLAGVQDIKNSVTVANEQLRELKHEYQTWKKRWQRVEENAQLERDLDNLRRQELWLAVQQAEEEIKVTNAHLEKQHKKLTVAELELQQAIDSWNEAKARFEHASSDVTNDPVLRDLQLQAQGLESEWKELQVRYRTLQEEKRDINEQVLGQRRTNEDLQRKIDEETERIAGRNRHALDAKVEQKAQLEREIQDLKEELNAAKAAQTNTERIDALKRDLSKVRSEIENADSSVQRFEDARRNRVAMFGKDLPAILKDIELLHNQRRWKMSKPIGPFGMYIRPKNPRNPWGALIESNLGPSVFAFAVDCKDDRDVLQSVFSKYR